MFKNLFKLILLISSIEIVFAETGTFIDLQQLINDNTSGTVKLEKDYVNSGTELQIEINKDLTLDLNGYVINGNRIGRVLYINNANVIIDDSRNTIEHKFDIDEANLLATINESSGKLIVKGGCITGGDFHARNGVGAGIFVDNGGQLTLESGNIIGNKMTEKFQFGAGMAARNNSKIIMNGGSVSYNSIRWEGYGGGIIVDNSEIIINNGIINNNYGTYGGGINVTNNAKLFINGGNIKENKADHNGAGVALFASKSEINGGIIEENVTIGTWIGIGGGISTDNGADLTIYGGLIRNNKANRGAGIGAWTGGNIKIYGGVITGNVSTIDTTPTDNTATNLGAGIFFDSSYTGYAATPSTLTIGGNTVINGNVNEVTGNEENLYFAEGQKIVIGTDENVPTEDMNVKITMKTPDTFATNLTADASKYFSSDDSYYEIGYSPNGLKLVHDSENPTGEISFKENSFLSLLNTITFGLFFNDNIGVTITANDDNDIKKIEYIITDTEKTLQDLKTQTNWINFSNGFNIDDEDKYIIYAKITDSVDKVIYISSNGFILDKTLPEIVGIDTNNGVHYTTQKFTIEDEYVDKVLINGVEVTDYILTGNIDETYEIDVYDKSGNSTYLSIRMMPIFTITNVIDEIAKDNVKSSDREIILDVKEKVNKIDKTYATDAEKEELQKIIDKCEILLNVIGNTLDKLELTSQAVNLYLNKELTNEDKVNIQKEIDEAYKISEENLTSSENISHKRNIEILEDILKNKKVYSYEIIKGDNQKFIESSISSYTLTIDGNYILFESISIGDLVLEKDIDYIVTEGSTIITFTDLGLNKLNTLNSGTYDVKIKFTNKEVISKIIINELIKEDNPKTGDQIIIYVVTGSISLVGLAGASLYVNKKRFN